MPAFEAGSCNIKQIARHDESKLQGMMKSNRIKNRLFNLPI